MCDHAARLIVIVEGSSVIEDWSRHMERHHTATAGSAAVDEEMVLRVDPVYAV